MFERNLYVWTTWLVISSYSPGVSEPRSAQGAAAEAPIEGSSAPSADDAAPETALAQGNADDAAVGSLDDSDLPRGTTGGSWMQELGEGLRPVTDTTAGAFGFLIELLPEIEVPPHS